VETLISENRRKNSTLSQTRKTAPGGELHNTGQKSEGESKTEKPDRRKKSETGKVMYLQVDRQGNNELAKAQSYSET